MFDAKRILDQFLGTGHSPMPGGAPGQAQQQPRQGSGGPADLLGGLLGGQGGSGGLASGALAGGLASFLLGSKSGRKLGKKAVQYGGMALVAGLAYRAYTNWQAQQGGQAVGQPARAEIAPPPQGSVFLPEGDAQDERARLLVSAMIAAAKADGLIDAEEQKRIFEKVGSLELDPDDKAFLMDQFTAPVDIDRLVRSAGAPEVAAEVYAASLLAIDPDHPAEQAYLQMLAARLGLPNALVEEIRAKVAEAQD